MSKGWISLHRKIQCHWLWDDKPFSKGQAWIDLLLLANHADKKFLLGNELIDCKAGSFITSELKLMERWGWGKTKTRAFLDVLQKDGMITKKTDRKKTTITIENYSVYSIHETTEEPEENHKQTAARPSADTNNNVNNDNNVNNNNNRRFTPPTVEDVRAYCQERKNGISPEGFVNYYTSKGWMIGKNKMKDWKAAVRSWESRQKKETAPANINPDMTDLDEFF